MVKTEASMVMNHRSNSKYKNNIKIQDGSLNKMFRVSVPIFQKKLEYLYYQEDKKLRMLMILEFIEWIAAE